MPITRYIENPFSSFQGACTRVLITSTVMDFFLSKFAINIKHRVFTILGASMLGHKHKYFHPLEIGRASCRERV